MLQSDDEIILEHLVKMSKQQPIILDCDPGRDDTWAIISLIKAEKKLNVKLVAITICNGNTSTNHSTRNALLTLEKFGRLDIPVFVGAESALINKSSFPKYHGEDGLQNIYQDKPDVSLLQKKHAVIALSELIEKYHGEIVICAIGPLTNIALLYKMFPGISSKLKRLVIMGGNYMGVGNIRGVTTCAEFNFWCDAESAKIVLDESTCDLLIFPWEAGVDSFNATPKEWRMKVLSNGKDVTNFMDPVDVKCDRFIVCDLYAVLCHVMPEIITKTRSCHVTVELGGTFTKGQMVLDHYQTKLPKVTIVEQIDIEMFKKFLLFVCDHDDIEI